MVFEGQLGYFKTIILISFGGCFGWRIDALLRLTHPTYGIWMGFGWDLDGIWMGFGWDLDGVN
jgi:hypothetical protein